MFLEVAILLGSWISASGVFLGILWVRKWNLDRQMSRMPVAEKLLRGPGEGLQKMLETLEDELSTQLATVFVVPLICASVYLLGRHATSVGMIDFGVAVSGGTAFVLTCRNTFRLLDQKRRYQLGLLGERAVGEELNQLMLVGCRVFHDVPNDPYGNIDHVLIAPSGVYAVETKARRKKSSANANAHKVFFDGRFLRFGEGPQEHQCLDQARQQAGRMSDWLSKAIGEAVGVQPVLALPGWFVERRGRGEVIVLSGRAVKTLVKGRTVIEPGVLLRIAHQLDQRCRDVEF